MNPLPLFDLVCELRARGLSIGTRQQLMVGTLLDRWDEIEIPELKNALAALLARNPSEATLVRETFVQFYEKTVDVEKLRKVFAGVVAPQDQKLVQQTFKELTPERIREPVFGRLLVVFRARWYFWVMLLLGLIAGSYFGYKLFHPDPAQRPYDARTTENLPPITPPAELKEPEIKVPMVDRFRWKPSLAIASCFALLVCLPAYLIRLRRIARSQAYKEWSYELDRTEGTYNYPISVKTLVPAFNKEQMDDIASVLSRSVRSITGSEMDVDKSLERTLQAGKCPQIVFRTRSTPDIPVLMLIDEADEMRIWRRQIQTLLDGLKSRGVYTDVWKFHGSPDRVYSSSGASIMLKQLTRLRSESPLLVISSGEGIVEGHLKPASWISALKYWRSRAWIHPIPDSHYWRSSLKDVPMEVWPLTPKGVLAAARQIARGDSQLIDLQSAKGAADRAVTPLDVQLLRSLLTYLPKKDPDSLELLRQRFYPGIPTTASLEALIAPPLDRPLTVGARPELVRAYLLELLKNSKPQNNPLGELHWRLDMALQQLDLPDQREKGIEELKRLADQPIMGSVYRAVMERSATSGHPERNHFPLPKETKEELQRTVLKRIDKNSRKQEINALLSDRAKYSTKPILSEVWIPVLAILAFLGIFWTGSNYLPFMARTFRVEIPQVQNGYTLSSYSKDQGRGPFTLEVEAWSGSPAEAELLAGEQAKFVADIQIQQQQKSRISMTAEQRGEWYYVRGKNTVGVTRLSNMVLIPDSRWTSGWLLVSFVDKNGKNLAPRDYVLTPSTPNGTASPLNGQSGTPLEAQAGEWKLTADPNIERNVTLKVRKKENPQPLQILVGSLTGRLVINFFSAPDKNRLSGTYTVRSKSNKVTGTAGTPLELEVGEWQLSATMQGQNIDRVVSIESGKTTQQNIPINYFPEVLPLDVRAQPTTLQMVPDGNKEITYFFQNLGKINITVTGWTFGFTSQSGKALTARKSTVLPKPITIEPNATQRFTDNIHLPPEIISTPLAGNSSLHAIVTRVAMVSQASKPNYVVLDETFLATDANGNQIRTSVRIPIEVLKSRTGSEESITVPQLIGLTRDEASQKLDNLKLTAYFSYEGVLGSQVNKSPVQQQPVGNVVVRQDPGAGSKVPPGSTVQVVLGDAPTADPKQAAPSIVVPNVVGMPRDQAIKALATAGLLYTLDQTRIRKSPSQTTQEEGIVLEQNPRAGEKVSPGTSVLLILGEASATKLL